MDMVQCFRVVSRRPDHSDGALWSGRPVVTAGSLRQRVDRGLPSLRSRRRHAKGRPAPLSGSSAQLNTAGGSVSV